MHHVPRLNIATPTDHLPTPGPCIAPPVRNTRIRSAPPPSSPPNCGGGKRRRPSWPPAGGQVGRGRARLSDPDRWTAQSQPGSQSTRSNSSCGGPQAGAMGGGSAGCPRCSATELCEEVWSMLQETLRRRLLRYFFRHGYLDEDVVQDMLLLDHGGGYACGSFRGTSAQVTTSN